MPVLRDIVKAQHSYRKCEEADIAPHFEKVKHWIPKREGPAFMERMLESIEEGKAFCTENTFLYYTKVDKRMATGLAMFGQGYPMEMVSLLIGIFTFEDNDTCLLRFTLHPGKELEEYRTLLSNTSIHRTHRDPKHPLLIKVNELRTKWVRLMEDKGVIFKWVP